MFGVPPNTLPYVMYIMLVYHWAILHYNIRAANSHALTVRLTHLTTFSRSHSDIRISHAFLRDFIGWQRTAPRISHSKVQTLIQCWQPCNMSFQTIAGRSDGVF